MCGAMCLVSGGVSCLDGGMVVVGRRRLVIGHQCLKLFPGTCHEEAEVFLRVAVCRLGNVAVFTLAQGPPCVQNNGNEVRSRMRHLSRRRRAVQHATTVRHITNQHGLKSVREALAKLNRTLSVDNWT